MKEYLVAFSNGDVLRTVVNIPRFRDIDIEKTLRDAKINHEDINYAIDDFIIISPSEYKESLVSAMRDDINIDELIDNDDTQGITDKIAVAVKQIMALKSDMSTIDDSAKDKIRKCYGASIVACSEAVDELGGNSIYNLLLYGDASSLRGWALNRVYFINDALMRSSVNALVNSLELSPEIIEQYREEWNLAMSSDDAWSKPLHSGILKVCQHIVYMSLAGSEVSGGILKAITELIKRIQN